MSTYTVKLGRIRAQGELSRLWVGTAIASDGRQYDTGIDAAGVNRRKARVVLLAQARQYFNEGNL